MKESQLDEAEIKKAISILDNLDISKVSIDDIHQIILPFFKGYQLNAIELPIGQRIFRGRICNKPTHLHELTYPPEKYVTELGRANSINQPMFYGTIGRHVPLFEIRADVDDYLMISLWETTKPIILNHIGFTKDVSQYLKSQRNLEDIYGFVKATHSANNLNSIVYEYLGNIFSKKADSLDYCKLTNAITMRLFGEPAAFDGILYPTIAMNGNSDNIVLRPSSVDNNLKLVFAEYIKIIDKQHSKYKVKKLDSATKTDGDNRILWTGKELGYQMKPGYSMVSKGNGWQILDHKGEKVEEEPVIEVYEDISDIEEKFHSDFPDTFRLTENGKINIPNLGEVEMIFRINTDFLNKEKTISLYIKETSFVEIACIALLSDVSGMLKEEHSTIVAIEKQDEDTPAITNLDVPFINRVYIYSETHFDINNIKSSIPENLEVRYMNH